MEQNRPSKMLTVFAAAVRKNNRLLLLFVHQREFLDRVNLLVYFSSKTLIAFVSPLTQAIARVEAVFHQSRDF